jgi:hypothetical protein
MNGRRGQQPAEKILDVLKRSATDAPDALKERQAGLNPEIGEMLVSFIGHNCEHYGQLVVYSRLNGVIASLVRLGMAESDLD